jgi:hypothetical protein
MLPLQPCQYWEFWMNKRSFRWLRKGNARSRAAIRLRIPLVYAVIGAGSAFSPPGKVCGEKSLGLLITPNYSDRGKPLDSAGEGFRWPWSSGSNSPALIFILLHCVSKRSSDRKACRNLDSFHPC